VERPLRLRYAVTDEAIECLRASKAFEGLVKPPANAKDPAKAIERGEAAQRAVIDGLRALNGFGTTDRSEAEIKVRDVLRAVEKPTAALRNAVWHAMSVRDPAAPVATNSKGEPQPDPKLRDYENVPMNEAVEDYMEREVLAFVEDAWVDEGQERIGGEISLTRLFYRYEPPRPLQRIDAEIRELEEEVHALTRELTT
jgi:type I restriction enzyme M protein